MKKDMGRQQARDRDGKTSDRGKEERCSGVQGGKKEMLEDTGSS